MEEVEIGRNEAEQARLTAFPNNTGHMTTVSCITIMQNGYVIA